VAKPDNLIYEIVERPGLDEVTLVATIALVAIFSILIHLGFASATSLASALIPVFIALALTLGISQDQQIGFVLIQQFVISCSLPLPPKALTHARASRGSQTKRGTDLAGRR
jgi:solute carrier family 13 (sodium-dependent dicarboxylate transporter), member 2/3/5